MGRQLLAAWCVLVGLGACRNLPLIAAPSPGPLGTVMASPNVVAAGTTLRITFVANPRVTGPWAQVANANATQVAAQGNITRYEFIPTGQEPEGLARVVVRGNNPQGPNSVSTTVVFDFTPPALGPAVVSTGNANVMVPNSQIRWSASDATAITCSVCLSLNGSTCAPLATHFDAASGACVSTPIACDSNDTVTLSPQSTDAAGNTSDLPALVRRCVTQGPVAMPLTTGNANPNYVPGNFVLSSRLAGDGASCDVCVSNAGGACTAWQPAVLQNGNCTQAVTCSDGALLTLAMRGTSANGIVGPATTATRVCDTSVQLGSLNLNGGNTATAVASGITLATTSRDLGAGMQTCQVCVASAGNCSGGPWTAASVVQGSCVSTTPISCTHGDTVVLSMRGVDAVGNAAQTAALTRTCDTTAPTFNALNVARIARKQLQYTWSATDTGAASNALSYSISYGITPAGTGGTGAQEGNSPLTGLQGSSGTLSNLPGCRRYYSSVTVSDGVGNKATQTALNLPVGCGNDGTFAPRGSAGNAETTSLALADFDRDGVLDAAMIIPADGQVVVRYSGAQVSPRGDFSVATQAYLPYAGKFLALALGDFDADGLQDIVASTDAGAVITLHNNGTHGTGAFSLTSSYGVGNNPRGIVVADFNADNIADVATVNTDDRKVSVLLGNGSNGVGNGTFGGAINMTAGAGTSIVAADVNADHNLDWLVTDGQGAGALVVALGNGDGTFNSASSYASGAGGNSQPSGLAVADFNRDNILDVAISNAGKSSVSVLLGNGSNGRGNGTFGSAAQINVNTRPSAVIALDLNGDAIVDLAVSHVATSSLGILSGGGANGRGTGAFGSESLFTPGSSGNALAAADIDGDGLTDLVVAGGASVSGTAVVGLATLLGRGGASAPDGSFLPPIFRGSQSGAPGYMVMGDLNADGITDYITPGGGKYEVAPGAGSNGQGIGVFEEHLMLTAFYNNAGGALVDLNNDGILDALFTHQGAQVGLLTGQGANGRGDGTFVVTSFTANPGAVRTFWVDAADFNADGVPDLAVGDRTAKNVAILIGQSTNAVGGTPQYTPTVTLPASGEVLFVRAADFNHDGIQDLVVCNLVSTGTNVQVYLGQGSNGRGNGTFGAAQSYAAGAAYAVTAALGDYNGDGVTDLAVSSQDSNIWLMFGQTSGGHGNGGFSTPVATRSCSTATVVVGADLNRDGVTDLAVVCSGQVGVLMGKGSRRGNGQFAAPTFVSTTRTVANVVVTDLDADNMLDLIMSDTGGAVVQIAYGSGIYP